MKKNPLAQIAGKKIRRQYFNGPLILLGAVCLAVPYVIFVFSLAAGELDPAAWPSTLWISLGVGLFYFPNWIVVALLGIYAGIIQPPLPSRHGSARFHRLLSYDELCNVYITNAEMWERIIEKNRKKHRM